jgi:hypothetical protein
MGKDGCQFFLSQLVSRGMQFINIVIVAVIYFTEFAVLVGQCHSTLEGSLALSLKIEIDSTHLFASIVVQPLDFPALYLLQETYHATLLPKAISR